MTRKSFLAHGGTGRVTASLAMDEGGIGDRSVTRALPILSGAADLPHANATFLDHLIGTWDILCNWRLPLDVCRAGLLHSCYSTAFYPEKLVDVGERRRVQKAIGQRAEHLVYLFCVMDRARFWQQVTGIDPSATSLSLLSVSGAGLGDQRLEVARKLIAIECANLAEQSAETGGAPTAWVWQLASWAGFLGRSYLPVPLYVAEGMSPDADQEAAEQYKSAVDGGSQDSAASLLKAARLNPLVAEPLLLSATISLELGQRDRAQRQALNAYSLFRAWGVAWDKRLSGPQWLELSRQVLRAASKSGHAQMPNALNDIRAFILESGARLHTA